MLKETKATGTREDFLFRKIYTMVEKNGLSAIKKDDPIAFISKKMIPHFEKTEDYEKCQTLKEISSRT